MKYTAIQIAQVKALPFIENTPVEVRVEPSMQFVQAKGRVFRDFEAMG